MVNGHFRQLNADGGNRSIPHEPHFTTAPLGIWEREFHLNSGGGYGEMSLNKQLMSVLRKAFIYFYFVGI